MTAAAPAPTCGRDRTTCNEPEPGRADFGHGGTWETIGSLRLLGRLFGRGGHELQRRRVLVVEHRGPVDARRDGTNLGGDDTELDGVGSIGRDDAERRSGAGRRDHEDRPGLHGRGPFEGRPGARPVDGQDIVRTAVGESMTGVPATVDMHFRNGAVAISYVADADAATGRRRQDAALTTSCRSTCRSMPHADEVTIHQLAQMTSGYQDFVLGNRTSRRAPTRTCTRRGRPRSSSPSRSTSRSGTRRDELGLRPHELRHPRARAREGHRHVDGRPAAGERARSAGA